MKKFLIFLIILMALPVIATVVPLDATFWDAGVMTAPDSVFIQILGNRDPVDTFTIPGDTSTVVAFMHDTLNRDYSSYTSLSLEWRAFFASGQSTYVSEDMSHRLIQDVNAVQISGDAGAADSLERMLDGNRATLFLSQLNIVADGDNTAILAVGSGAGHGLRTFGGSTGHGLYTRGGASGGDGIHASSEGGGGSGMSLTGSAAGPGLYALGGSGNGDGAVFESQFSGVAIDLDGTPRIAGYIDSVALVGAVPATVALQTTSDSILDSLGNLSVTASITDADMASIADTIFGKDTGDYQVAGKMGILFDAKISDAGGVAVISASDMADIADSSFNRLRDSMGFKGDSSMRLTYFEVIGDDGAGAIFKIENIGGGPAIAAYATGNGDAIYLYSVSGHAIDANRSDTGADIKGRLERVDTAGYLLAGGFGDGDAAVTLYLYDDTASAVVPDVDLTVYYLSGASYLTRLPTKSGGFANFNFTVNESLIVTGAEAGYVIQMETLYVDTIVFVDTLNCYSVPVDSPSGSNTCNKYFYVSDISGDVQLKDISAVVTLSTQGENIEDTCNGTVVALIEKWIKKPDPVTGQISFELIWSSCMYPAGAIYSIEVFSKRTTTIAAQTFTVPDSATSRLRFID